MKDFSPLALNKVLANRDNVFPPPLGANTAKCLLLVSRLKALSDTRKPLFQKLMSSPGLSLKEALCWVEAACVAVVPAIRAKNVFKINSINLPKKMSVLWARVILIRKI